MNSGIDGTVLAGPTCPVDRPESPCPDRPLADAPIQVTPAGGGNATTVQSDSEGHFRVALAPGEYMVTPLPLNSVGLPAPGQAVQVLVQAGELTNVTLTYDTGIR